MPESIIAPFRLKPWFSPRPWGRRDLEPWYSPAQVNTSGLIGEAWLTGPQCIAETSSLAGQTLASIVASHPAQLLGSGHESPAEFPLLIKLLFPADKLSVQVHPDDAHAQAMGQPRGKTECWYVLEAEPSAQIALRLNPALNPEKVTSDAVRAAIAAGTLEDLLHWVPVSVGDMVFVDAGTVHAIGPGMVLLETQQTCDVTYRMYDYGRPRELHIDHALRVMKIHAAAGKVTPQKMQGAPSKLRLGGKGVSPEFTRLIEQRYFVVDRYDLAPGQQLSISAVQPGCMVTLTGAAAVIGGSEGAVDALPGQAIIIPAGSSSLIVQAGIATSFVHCWAP